MACNGLAKNIIYKATKEVTANQPVVEDTLKYKKQPTSLSGHIMWLMKERNTKSVGNLRQSQTILPHIWNLSAVH